MPSALAAGEISYHFTYTEFDPTTQAKWAGGTKENSQAYSEETPLHQAEKDPSPRYTLNFSVVSKSNLDYNFNTSAVTAEKSPLVTLDSWSG